MNSSQITLDPLESIAAQISDRGYALMSGIDLRPHIERFGSLADWPTFSASWGDLHIDPYMADGGRYRRRRHACFAIDKDAAPHLAPHQAHYQSLEYNRLNGGIPRWFSPIDTRVCEGRSMQTILRFGARLFETLAPDITRWHCEAHQFRIEASPNEAAQPTPEGAHRDGVDYVLVLLIQRHNIASGTTQIFNSGGDELGSFTLAEPLDAAIIDDHRIFHGVTPVAPTQPDQASFRDVLVITYSRHPETA